ncbi:MAG: choice-of-anchor D domain-containing protein, partial [Bacteroidales bacterium]|nr:choice-of-anchor D domain-containing protein [Bacteroidales bacterium]
ENLTGIITRTISGTGAAAFNVTPTTLPTGGGTFTITFNPATAGDYTATLTISSIGANDKIVTVSGKGVLELVPTLIVDTTPLTFGNVNVGTTSPAKNLAVSGTDLTGNINYTKTGADASFFTVTETSWNPATGGTLSITFSPTEARAYSATLNLSSAGADPKTINLSGTGVTPSTEGQLVAQWNDYTPSSPPSDGIFFATDGSDINTGIATLTREPATGYSITFSVNTDGIAASSVWQDAETIDKYWITTFSTIGFTDLTFTSKQRGSNTGPKHFKVQYKIGSGVWTDVADGVIVVANDNYISGVKENHPLPSAMSNQEEVSLRWICTSNEAISSANPVVAAGVNRLNVVVYGVETTPAPYIIANPANLNFGKVEVGTTPEPQTITVSGLNLTGNISWNKGGADASAFNVTASPWNPTTGGTLTVTFAPTEERDYNATITLSSAGASNKIVNLTGTGMVPADFFEDFEDMTGSGSYNGAEVTFASGLWFIKGYTTMTSGSDRFNGTRSIRLRGQSGDVEHRAEMMFDKPNGAGTVSFKYGSYAAHKDGEIQLQTSTDKGATWQNQGEVITVPAWTGELLTASIEVNIEGNIRIRVIKTNAKASSSVNVDDIEISDFDSSMPNISVSPMSLDFGDVDVQTTSSAQTVTVSGSNLVGNITYTKGGADASMFTIAETSWNPTTGGKLDVTFTPSEAKVYTATITFNTQGATPKTVTLIGTGTTGGIGCNGGFEAWTNERPDCWWGDKTTFTKAGIIQYSANVHGGNYACQLINTESAHRRFSTQPVTVVAGKVYDITFWVRGKGDIRTALFDARESNNGYTPYNEWITIDSDTWTQYTQKVVAETNAANSEFIFSIRDTDESRDHIQIDDVEISTQSTDIVEITAFNCTVFPNPSNGIFNVITDSNVNVRVYSLTGALLLEQQINKTGTLNLETYPTGIYIMKVIDDKQGCAVRKLIVQ